MADRDGGYLNHRVSTVGRSTSSKGSSVASLPLLEIDDFKVVHQSACVTKPCDVKRSCQIQNFCHLTALRFWGFSHVKSSSLIIEAWSWMRHLHKKWQGHQWESYYVDYQLLSVQSSKYIATKGPGTVGETPLFFVWVTPLQKTCKGKRAQGTLLDGL